jgi:hypothetical protein
MNNSMQIQIDPGSAVKMFWDATFHARLHQFWAFLTRRTFRLLDLDDTLRDAVVTNSHYGGLKTVLIEHIRGTQGKADDFDAEFNPIQERTRSRWLEIAYARLRGRDLPPVELVQVGDVYYVRDGHHRISVSHWMGQSYIDAEITVMQLQRRMLG